MEKTINSRKHGTIRFFTSGIFLKAEVNGEIGEVWECDRKTWHRVMITAYAELHFDSTVKRICIKFNSGYAMVMKPLLM